MNPIPDLNRRRATSIMGADVMPDEVDRLLAFAEDCRLNLADARKHVGRVVAALSKWRDKAKSNRVPEREVAMMAESIEKRLDAMARISQRVN